MTKEITWGSRAPKSRATLTRSKARHWTPTVADDPFGLTVGFRPGARAGTDAADGRAETDAEAPAAGESTEAPEDAKDEEPEPSGDSDEDSKS